ncbi:suppressor of fused homolog [Octopus vulgaris]|uniref:Suppressor of fused homolog n=2 Tax=Octopus TaxID=6643 RepID=A0AA36EZT6_OCTVU|nr:suppressor of fused homolog [Octopus sinensis]CAI9717818.1 suppressor of fused homolog [Octopus vulgaris]
MSTNTTSSAHCKIEDEDKPYSSPNFPSNMHLTPPGFESIYAACRRTYPNQSNPLQVTALTKYWLGGPDPLDYISMYANSGDPNRNIPPHWHYISFGLSDLHGDGRVHERSTNNDGPSGFGFELTFRLRREPGETNPPTWPAALMQSLGRYVFQSENILCSGDHVSWHAPLDGSESRVQHMLMTEDVQLQPILTPFGVVSFIQIVGVCSEELKAAQHWNGPGVIELLRSVAVAGGAWLITDMRRGESIFELDPSLQERVDSGIEQEGSNLSGVSSRCFWDEILSNNHGNEDNKENRLIEEERRCSLERPHISDIESEQIRAVLQKGLHNSLVNSSLLSEQNENIEGVLHNQNGSRKESFDSTLASEVPSELFRTRTLDNVHLKLNLEAGLLLPLALKGRLKHGRHFTFKSVLNDVAVTLVSSSVTGSIADEQHPYATHGPWLQILLTDDFIEDMLQDIEELSDPEYMEWPKTYEWPRRKLLITIFPDDM